MAFKRFVMMVGGFAALGLCAAGCSSNNGGGGGGGTGGTPGLTGTGTGGTTGPGNATMQTGGVGGGAVGTGSGGTGSGVAGAAGSGSSMGTGMMSTGGTGMMSTGGTGAMAMGTGGMGTGGMGTAGMGTAGMAEPTGPTMPCLTQGVDLLLIGDSYIDAPTYLTPALEAKASADGQLPAGQHYNVQAVAGTVSSQIQNQWLANKSPAPKFVVMDGGGNDVLLGAPQCIAASGDDPVCQGVADMANATIKSIWDDMKASGVKGVIYFYYPHTPISAGGTLVDYGGPKAQANCDAENDDNFQCVFVSTSPALDDMGYYLDNVHPTANGGPDVLAGLVWDAMKQSCIGQTSGCCAP